MKGIFPGRGNVTWRDWYTHDVVNASTTVGANTTLAAPLGHINVHVRDGAVLLLHAEPGYTTTETREGPFSLLVTLPGGSTNASGNSAFGTAYIDDGVSFPPGPNTTLVFAASSTAVTSAPSGSFNISQKLEQITVLGVQMPSQVSLAGTSLNSSSWSYTGAQEKLVVSGVEIDLNEPVDLSWS